jgi:hypothetical protein
LTKQECAKYRIKSNNSPDDEGLEDEVVPFEIVVLDNALCATTTLFSQNLSTAKPVFDVLLDLAVRNPCDTTLKKILTFKKSLMSFETR